MSSSSSGPTPPLRAALAFSVVRMLTTAGPTFSTRSVKSGNACAVVESVKAASDVYSPVSGKVVAVNSALADKPETINEDAYGEGWIFVVQPDDMAEMDEMLDPDDYATMIEDEEH